MLTMGQATEENRVDSGSREDLLKQAFDIIMELNDDQLKRLLERMGYFERKAV